jgi:hypothetical protein
MKRSAKLDRDIAEALAREAAKRRQPKTPSQRKADELYALYGAKALECAEHEWNTAELTDEEARALDGAILILSGMIHWSPKK